MNGRLTQLPAVKSKLRKTGDSPSYQETGANGSTPLDLCAEF